VSLYWCVNTTLNTVTIENSRDGNYVIFCGFLRFSGFLGKFWKESGVEQVSDGPMVSLAKMMLINRAF
jgi:hypothetical protein